jgi:hypothetical protein
MFTRNSAPGPMPLDPLEPGLSASHSKHPSPRSPSTEAGKSVISNDEGDVGGAEIIIGEQGRVTGTVAAERVIVRGRISGVIRAMTVALQPSARVEGDIHHMSLVIEQGAEFDGRCRRPADASELQLDLDAYG